MLCISTYLDWYIYCTLRGRIKGAASAIHPIIRHSLRGGARHVIAVIAFTQKNKACKRQCTINQLKHGNRRAVRINGTRGVVWIDHSALGYASCYGYLDHTPRNIIARTELPYVL